jgi:hypothetical protein
MFVIMPDDYLVVNSILGETMHRIRSITYKFVPLHIDGSIKSKVGTLSSSTFLLLFIIIIIHDFEKFLYILLKLEHQTSWFSTPILYSGGSRYESQLDQFLWLGFFVIFLKPFWQILG